MKDHQFCRSRPDWLYSDYSECQIIRSSDRCDLKGAAVNKDDPISSHQNFALDAWIRASTCGPDGGHCIEVNLSVAGLVGIRDSKKPTSPILVFDDHEWRSFLTAARAGQYDR